MSKEVIMSAEQKVERIRQSPVDYLICPTHKEYLLIQQDDYWTIRYRGHITLLKSTRGLHYLTVLLPNPGQEFHVSQLLARRLDVSTPTAGVALHRPVAGGLFAGLPVLDVRAKTEYKRRLKELQQDLEEAERFNDPQRKTEAQNEIQAIADYLASAVGLGGRNRRASSDAERARCAVTKCIKKAMQKIGEAMPSLGYHLAARIKTGYFCSYNPHPERPVNWKVLTASLRPVCDLKSHNVTPKVTQETVTHTRRIKDGMKTTGPEHRLSMHQPRIPSAASRALRTRSAILPTKGQDHGKA
ncbi:MAG TPA: hypothetical protein VJ420_00040 [Candidatus Udaeobacter sp.]|nr:hypothetical protein [Candidatus Udaeobacter sp.]